MTIQHMKYAAHIVQTGEIIECDNLKVLYKIARGRARDCRGYEGSQTITVRFYANLSTFNFGEYTPFHVASW